MTELFLYRTELGPVAVADGREYRLGGDWLDWVNDDHLHDRLLGAIDGSAADGALADAVAVACAPIGDQELWGCGVTYERSRVARMEESQDAGGGDFYDRVYTAERPEVFLKATAHRVVGNGETLHLRSDSNWIVPEPELVLVVTRRGAIVGCTVGNDLSCRDIEGENPLYLPQAKTYDRCAAVGPGIRVLPGPVPRAWEIRLRILRDGNILFEEGTGLERLRRSPEELVAWLYRDNAQPNGCLLLTGTGIVPPDEVSLRVGDVVEISIDGIGTLVNPVA